MRRMLIVLWLACMLAAAAGCNGPAEQDPPRTAEPAPAAQDRLGMPNESAPNSPQAVPTAIKQLILLYTGDTLSAVLPANNNDEAGKITREGGLPALTGALYDYQRNITNMARMRVEAQEGSPDAVRADSELGLLGDHPYLLLDYGGWERDTDPAGLPYVELQLRMYRDLKYAAVGMKLYERLIDPLWAEYAALEKPATLLNSAGALRPKAPAVLDLVTREIHGARWGIASLPLPPKRGKPAEQVEQFRQYVEDAAQLLEKRACRYRILLCPGGPEELYEQLATDLRFTVVIGVAPPSLAAPEGPGKLSTSGPLMLPELDWGGQEFAACHIIYPSAGDAPAEFNFVRHRVLDDLQSPYPYRKQAAAAIARRQELQQTDQPAAQ